MRLKPFLLTLPAWGLVLVLYGFIGYVIYVQAMEPTPSHFLYSLAAAGVALFMLPVFEILWDISKSKP
jgi:hypothetical protein